LQVEPTRPFRDKYLLDARMFSQPGTGLGAMMEARDCR
jgi:hypothetical protein